MDTNIITVKYCLFRFQLRNMKHLVLVFAFLSVVANGQTNAFEHKFEITSQYCGGATPTEEVVLASNHKLKPFANKTIYMYKKGKCVDSLITDSLGWARKRIKSGKYDLFLAYKHFKKVPFGSESEFDMECMKKEWMKPNGTLKISWKGTHFIDRGISYKFCPWQYNCLKERHIPEKQN